MNSYFGKLRVAECEHIAQKFGIDLEALVERLKIRKVGADACKEALRVYLSSANEISTYLKVEYKKARDENRDIELNQNKMS